MVKPLARERFFQGFCHDQMRAHGRGPDYDAHLLSPHWFIEDVIHSTSQMYRKSAKGAITWQATRLGQAWAAFSGPSPMSVWGFSVSPHIQLYINSSQIFAEAFSSHPGDGAEKGHPLNLLVQWIRDAACTTEFARVARLRRHSAMRASESADKLILKVFRVATPPLVFRFDLCNSDSQHWPNAIEQHLKSLLAKWRKFPWHKSMRAYLWKLQRGDHSGHYVHMTIFLSPEVSGNSVLHDISTLWSAIGGPSNTLLSDKPETMFGAGAGAWPISAANDQREQLRDSFRYLTQKDEIFRVRPALCAHVFGRSNL